MMSMLCLPAFIITIVSCDHNIYIPSGLPSLRNRIIGSCLELLSLEAYAKLIDTNKAIVRHTWLSHPQTLIIRYIGFANRNKKILN